MDAARRLRDLADAVDQEMATNPYWQSQLVGRESWWAHGMQAVGGAGGDLAAALGPDPARAIADLLESEARRLAATVLPEWWQTSAPRTFALADTILKETHTMSETVNVRVLLVIGDQAEIVADAEDATTPERYPVDVVAADAGVPRSQLAGARLTAEVGRDDRLRNFRRRS